MREVSPRQQQLDQAVVSSYLEDSQALPLTPQWDTRFWSAGSRVDALYEEFTPQLAPQMRMMGKILGAGGMAFIEHRYGADVNTAQLYGGSYETEVLAFYHNAVHSWNFMRNMFRYALVINGREGPDASGNLPYDDQFFMRVPHIASNHDSVMGNGRGHDERQAALFAGHLMVQLGATLLPDEASMAGIEATTWDEEKHCQLIYPGEDFPRYRKAARVADLLTVHDRLGMFESICVMLENMTKKRYDRTLTLEAQERGFNLRAASLEECMEFIDGSDTLRGLLHRLLRQQTAFFNGFTLSDPTVSSEFPGLPENRAFMSDLQGRYTGKPGGLNSVDLLEEVKLYAAVA